MDESLENRIAVLEKFMASLQQVDTIPYEVDKSFVARGYIKSSKPPIPLGSGLDQGAWINRVISLSGDPQQIMTTQYPEFFGQITEGQFQGLWIPLYQPPFNFT